MKRRDIIRKNAIVLRVAGKTYSQIAEALHVPKGTLHYWLNEVTLGVAAQARRSRYVQDKLAHAQQRSRQVRARQRIERVANIRKRLAPLSRALDDSATAKVVLATLYLGEGGKHRRSLMFGNSDELIIRLFMRLLRQVYAADEKKFRCTVQCRADQNIADLEKYWSSVTRIPKSRFYKAQVDPRTKGKRSQKLGYKGVCRIDYLSADLYDEVRIIPEIIMGR